jgi:glycosyltransferase involved in cell wall biosynthesis
MMRTPPRDLGNSMETSMSELAGLDEAAQRRLVAGLRGPVPIRHRPLVVAHVVEGCQGGVGTAVRHLICGQALDELIGNVHLFADPRRMGDMLSDVPATLHTYRSSRNPAQIRQVVRELQGMLQALRPDIVYLHSTFPGVYGRLRTHAKEVPWTTIYCAHGWAFTQHVSRFRQKAYMWIERYLAGRADAIISISHYEHASAVKAGISHRSHKVIPHGIPAAEANIRAAMQVESGGIHLLFVGRFDQQKGVDLLFDAWKDPRLADMHLWLIGDTTLDHDFKVPIQPNVHALGWIRNDLMDSYIRSFDAVIMPSRWEGFGLVALEAMRNGRAVLASRRGGLPELIIDQVNGRLFEPDSLEEVIQMLVSLNHRDLTRMGGQAYDVFRAGFAWDTCYQRWSRVTLEAHLTRSACSA